MCPNANHGTVYALNDSILELLELKHHKCRAIKIEHRFTETIIRYLQIIINMIMPFK
jgi:hypothetical protein